MVVVPPSAVVINTPNVNNNVALVQQFVIAAPDNGLGVFGQDKEVDLRTLKTRTRFLIVSGPSQEEAGQGFIAVESTIMRSDEPLRTDSMPVQQEYSTT